MKTIKLPIRWRVTLIYTTVAAVVMSVFGAVVYDRVETSLTRGRTQYVENEVAWAVLHTNPPGEFSVDDLYDLARTLYISPTSDLRFAVLDATGNFLQPASPAQTQRYPDIPYEHLLQEGVSQFYYVPPNPVSGERLGLYIFPVKSPDGRLLGLVQAQINLNEVHSVLVQLRWLLISGIALGVAVTVLVGIAVTTVSLRPLRQMATLSKQTASGQFNQRVAVPSSGDEVEGLALAMNRMLEQIEEHILKDRNTEQKLRQFVADAAHELRSPLTALQGNAEFIAMLSGRDLETTSKVLSAMSKDIHRLVRLTNDLLALAYLDAVGKLDIRVSDLGALCQEVCTAINGTAGSKTIAFHGVSGGPITAPVDPDRIKQVLLNLLQNAMQHTREDGEVAVSLSSGVDGIVITVADNGEGIAAEHLPHIFDRFYRASASRSRSAGGTGLGLAIVKAIVEGHNGRVHVTSVLGKGTTVTVLLPKEPNGAKLAAAL